MFDVHFTTPDWMADAACAGIGGDFWFPPKGGHCREAHAICKQCPVHAECLQYAIDNDLDGTWGGVTERARSVMAGRRAS